MNDDTRKIVITSGPMLDVRQNESAEWIWEVRVGADTIGRSYKGFFNKEECLKNLLNLSLNINLLEKNQLLR